MKNHGAINRSRRQKSQVQVKQETSQARAMSTPTPPGMEGASEFINCDLRGNAYGIYAPNGGKAILRESKIGGGIAGIEAGGDAKFHLENTDVETY